MEMHEVCLGQRVGFNVLKRLTLMNVWCVFMRPLALICFYYVAKSLQTIAAPPPPPKVYSVPLLSVSGEAHL